MERDIFRRNNIRLGFMIALALLKNKGEISLNQIKSIPLINKEEAKLIYTDLLSSPNIKLTKEKISSSPYLEFDKVLTLKNEFT